MDDTRNVTNEFKNLPHQEIVEALNRRGVHLEIAIENLERDFNMGTIVRTANAFGVRKVHIVGSRQWNKRGAMMTDKYLEVQYYKDSKSFRETIGNRQLVAIENNTHSESLHDTALPPDGVLIFGSEASGLSEAALAVADMICHIPQRGSTRSLNVGVAAGIAMWEWARQHRS